MDLVKNIFKGDKVIWIIFLCLCLISIIEVFSAASTLTYKSGDHWGPITQHSVILMVGVVVVVFMHNIPYKWFQVFPVFFGDLRRTGAEKSIAVDGYRLSDNFMNNCIFIHIGSIPCKHYVGSFIPK